ncbi:MAG: hypothetical protein IJ240_05585 [Clostridia bacterium]|nr:hypothetical protein [Clostridia bacterium]
MYKKQMTIQRVICFLSLVASVVVFLYSLGLMTDLYDSLYPMMRNPDNLLETDVPGSIIYYDMQPFNRLLLRFSIVLILLSCLLFITNTSTRRKYYVGNYAVVALNVIANVAIAVWAHGQLTGFKAQYLQLDFESLALWSSIWETPYIGPESTFWFDAHYAVFALTLLASALLILNVFWKRKLMKDEQSLLAAGKAANA